MVQKRLHAQGSYRSRSPLSHTTGVQLCKALMALHRVLKHHLNSITDRECVAFSAKAEQKRRKWKFLIAPCLRQPQKCRVFSAVNQSQPDPLPSLKYPQLPLVFMGAENYPQLLKAAWWAELWRASRVLPPAPARMGREEQVAGGR